MGIEYSLVTSEGKSLWKNQNTACYYELGKGELNHLFQKEGPGLTLTYNIGTTQRRNLSMEQIEVYMAGLRELGMPIHNTAKDIAGNSLFLSVDDFRNEEGVVSVTYMGIVLTAMRYMAEYPEVVRNTLDAWARFPKADKWSLFMLAHLFIFKKDANPKEVINVGSGHALIGFYCAAPLEQFEPVKSKAMAPDRCAAFRIHDAVCQEEEGLKIDNFRAFRDRKGNSANEENIKELLRALG